MPVFRFTAVDAAGRPQGGDLDAASMDEARRQLAARGWTQIELVSPAAVPVAVGGQPIVGAVATLAGSERPLTGGLQALAAEATSPRVRRALLDLSRRVAAGESLETALANADSGVPPALAAVVQAGQRSGQLPLALARYVDLVREGQELQRTLWVSLTYPVLLLGGCVAVMVLLSAVVMPMFGSIFNDFGVELPSLTAAVLSLSHAVNGYWPWLLLAAASLAVVLYGIFRWTFSAAVRSRILDYIPLIGPLHQNFAVARLCRMLSLLVAGRTPLPEALRLSGSAANPALAASAERIARGVEAGLPPEEAARHVGGLPTWIKPILRWHDRGPAFSEALDAAADLCITRSQSQITLATIVAEPAVIVFIGLTVGLSVISLFLPLVKLLNELS